MTKRTNYIIAAWGGPRRVVDARYERDRASYLRMHLGQLKKLKHDCHVSLVVSRMADADDGHREFEKAIVTELSAMADSVYYRMNAGMSYGAWSYVFERTAFDFDYFIFMEDDYVFLLDGFDSILIDQYKALGDCVYLCGNVCPLTFCTGHARHSCGIISRENALLVTARTGRFEFLNDPFATERDHEIYQTQKRFSSSMVTRTGKKLYDVCDTHSVGLRMKHGGTRWYGRGERILGPVQSLWGGCHRYPTMKQEEWDAHLSKT